MECFSSRKFVNVVLFYLVIVVVSCRSLSITTKPSPLENLGNDTAMDDDVISNSNGSINNELPFLLLKCSLSTVDPYMHNTVRHLLKDEKVTLIEYKLSFRNYTDNPLSGSSMRAYKLDKWSRVTTSQGQTLLSLAFNYGVLSMATLTLGTHSLDVDLIDSPQDCIWSATEEEKIEIVKYLLVRDFQNSVQPTLIDEQRVCHEVIRPENGYAMFRDTCYYTNPNTMEVVEDDDSSNIWLDILYVLLLLVRYALIFFGPILFTEAIESMSKEQIPYVVSLKDTLVKTIMVSVPEGPQPSPSVKCRRKVDLSNRKGFPKLKDSVNRAQVPLGKPIKVKFSQYDITVNYKRMLTENIVKVGLLQSLYSAVFECNIRNIGPFQECCHSHLLVGCPGTKKKITWIKLWRIIAKVLMVLLIPVPYYIRLIVYYQCEHEEVMLRKKFISAAGLHEKYETTSSLMHYLTPTHPLFICIYIVYGLAAIMLAFVPKKKKDGRLLKILVGSFRDLRTLNWTETLSMVVSNVIWPFKRFGLFGCLVCFVYWPIAIPVTILVAAVYTTPTIYLTLRMAFYSKSAIFERMRRRKKNRPYQVNTNTDQDMHKFEAQACIDKSKDDQTSIGSANEIALDEIDSIKPKEHFKTLKDNISLASSIMLYQSTSRTRLIKYIVIAILCIATLYGVVIILSEVIGCLVEVVVFTIMGVIVNASALLKYVMLILMIFVYCCDCFNNMEKKYLKLNKALFSEVKGRIKNLSDVTSLPSFLQENHGFKSQELGEQAEYESPDDIAEKPLNHWMINDLVLFVDSADMPRIPKQLFDEVCQIRVAGVPGPVFRGLIEAGEQFLKIVAFILFVFIVVLTFGSVYKVSTTNQMLATMVGGFLPMVLKTFMAPPAPDVEIGTVSFKNKLDEVIKNFCQYWPIYDMPFEVVKEENDEKKKDDDVVKEEKEVGTKKDDDAKAAIDCVGADGGGLVEKTGALYSKKMIAAPNVIDANGDCLLPHQQQQQQCLARNLDNYLVEGGGQLSVPGASNSFKPKNGDGDCKTIENNNNLNRDSERLDNASVQGSIRTAHFAEQLEKVIEEDEGVDILICMPNKYDEVWLDEWSDIASLNP